MRKYREELNKIHMSEELKQGYVMQQQSRNIHSAVRNSSCASSMAVQPCVSLLLSASMYMIGMHYHSSRKTPRRLRTA